eukprot:SAG22_NODE_271_length_13227_cov_34.282983_3_plen_307_part_00
MALSCRGACHVHNSFLRSCPPSSVLRPPPSSQLAHGQVFCSAEQLNGSPPLWWVAAKSSFTMATSARDRWNAHAARFTSWIWLGVRVLRVEEAVHGHLVEGEARPRLQHKLIVRAIASVPAARRPGPVVRVVAVDLRRHKMRVGSTWPPMPRTACLVPASVARASAVAAAAAAPDNFVRSHDTAGNCRTSSDPSGSTGTCGTVAAAVAKSAAAVAAAAAAPDNFVRSHDTAGNCRTSLDPSGRTGTCGTAAAAAAAAAAKSAAAAEQSYSNVENQRPGPFELLRRRHKGGKSSSDSPNQKRGMESV